MATVEAAMEAMAVGEVAEGQMAAEGAEEEKPRRQPGYSQKPLQKIPFVSEPTFFLD
jgi:hypothetical protein